MIMCNGKKKWGYTYYHDDIGIDVVRARLIWVPVLQHHASVVDWKQKQRS